MFNVGGGEVLVILLVALLVLGPTKLPQAAKQVGAAVTQLRRLSSGFQNELRAAMEDEDTATPAPSAGQGSTPGDEGDGAPVSKGDGAPVSEGADTPDPSVDPARPDGDGDAVDA